MNMIDTKGRYRRNGKDVYIKQPEFEELEFVSKLWGDEETMKDIGGTFNFSKEKWSNFYKKMIYPTDGKNFYCLIYNLEDEPVGEVSFHGYDSITKLTRFNVKVLNKYRNHGYGEEAVRLLLEYYFFEFGGGIVMDNVSNPVAIRMLNKIGFQVVRQLKNETTMKLVREDFINNKKYSNKKIGILMYNGMRLSDFSLCYDILGKVNEIKKSNIFDIYGINYNDKVICDDRKINIINLNGEKSKEEPDVLIIPGGNPIVKENIKNVLNIIRRCDYLCVQGEGIKFLIEGKLIDGMFIPKNQIDIDDKKYIKENMLISDNFIDNGRIMLGSSVMGEIEMILSLIDKIAGRELAENVKNNIGIK